MSWEPIGTEHSARVVLGALLLDIDNLSTVSALEPEDLYPAVYGILFREIRAMARRKLPVDISTLVGRFNEQKLQEIGGRGVIFQLTEGLPRSFKELPKHVEVLLGERKRRGLQQAIFKMQKALDADTDLDQAKDAFLEELARVPRTSKATATQARLIQLSDVKARDVQWLWEPLLPLGMLSMVSGDSDVGKSFMLMAVAAGLTLGQLPCGGGRCEPVNILHLTNENSAEYVLRPRFDKLGGDTKRYFHCPGSEWIDEDGEVHTGAITMADIPMLDDALARSQAKLVLIDPIQSYLPSKTDAHRANEVRQLLDPLAKLAEKHACCIVLIRHLNKGVGGKAIYRGSMSVDFTAAVRSEMLVGYLPDDHSKRAVVHIVHNLGAAAQSVGFEIDQTGEFSWTGHSDITAEQLLADPGHETEEASGKVKEAVEWLRDFLTPDSQPGKDCVVQGRKSGISERTLWRAKAMLGVKVRKTSFKGGFVWHLPELGHAPEEIGRVGTLRDKSHKTDDLYPAKPLADFADHSGPMAGFEECQTDLADFGEQSKHAIHLADFGKYNNKEDLSINYSVTNVEVCQLPGTLRAREERSPNGFDPTN